MCSFLCETKHNQAEEALYEKDVNVDVIIATTHRTK